MLRKTNIKSIDTKLNQTMPIPFQSSILFFFFSDRRQMKNIQRSLQNMRNHLKRKFHFYFFSTIHHQKYNETPENGLQTFFKEEYVTLIFERIT